jgi:hypothetical protein
MAKIKDFGAPGLGDNLEDITFVLHGESFTCRRGVPGKVMIDIAAQTANEDDPAAGAKVIDDFFRSVLISEESYDRLNGILRDPDKMIPIETIMDIVSWLMEVYGERPTQRSEDSSTGQ